MRRDEKRFFSYSNGKGDRRLETRVAAFFACSGSKQNTGMGQAVCVAGTGSREEDLASKYIPKSTCLLEEWDWQRGGLELKAQVPPQPAGPRQNVLPPPALSRAALPPCWVAVTAAASKGHGWTGREGESLGTLLGYGLMEFPLLLLLGKSLYPPWKTLILATSLFPASGIFGS